MRHRTIQIFNHPAREANKWAKIFQFYAALHHSDRQLTSSLCCITPIQGFGSGSVLFLEGSWIRIRIKLKIREPSRLTMGPWTLKIEAGSSEWRVCMPVVANSHHLDKAAGSGSGSGSALTWKAGSGSGSALTGKAGSGPASTWKAGSGSALKKSTIKEKSVEKVKYECSYTNLIFNSPRKEI